MIYERLQSKASICLVPLFCIGLALRSLHFDRLIPNRRSLRSSHSSRLSTHRCLTAQKVYRGIPIQGPRKESLLMVAKFLMSQLRISIDDCKLPFKPIFQWKLMGATTTFSKLMGATAPIDLF